MSALSWCLALGFLVTTLAKGVSFHQKTVCRQEAWLLSFDIETRRLFSKTKKDHSGWHTRCRLIARSTSEKTYWFEMNSIRQHEFTLPLKGTL